MRFRILLALLLTLTAVPAFAQVPPTMSYQGVLTDGAGNLVPDGFYDLTFRIYTVPTAGSAAYTEAHTGVNHVQVAHGGFSVLLGSITPLNGYGFDGPLYLGVQVAADPELAPRTALSSSPYALGLRLPFQVSATAGAPLMNGYAFSSQGAALDFLTSLGSPFIELEPDGSGSGGFFLVSGGTGACYIDGNASGAGSPAFRLYGAASDVFMDTNVSGDASVQLPANAISAGEILDEPGIAQGHTSGQVNVPIGATMGDIVTVTLTTPAAGYIVVQADGQHGLGGSATSTQNSAYIQIDETAGGTADGSHYFSSGYFQGPAGAHNFFSWTPVSVHRTYYKAAGTYTFRLEASGTQNEAAYNYFWNPTITATFYPTSYGTVTAAPALAEAGSFSQRTVTTSAGNGPGQPELQGVTVDLRELELRDAKAAADAERAHLQLVEARLAQQTQARTAAQAAARAATQAQK
jgi:hypothetical protein